MSQIGAFVVGTLLSFAVAIGVLLVLRKRLTSILSDLCENPDRGRFWVLMVNLTVCLAATLLSMLAGEGDGAVRATFWSIVKQVEYALGGMIASLLVLAIALAKSIVRFEERRLASTRPRSVLTAGAPHPAGGTPS